MKTSFINIKSWRTSSLFVLALALPCFAAEPSAQRQTNTIIQVGPSDTTRFSRQFIVTPEVAPSESLKGKVPLETKISVSATQSAAGVPAGAGVPIKGSVLGIPPEETLSVPGGAAYQSSTSLVSTRGTTAPPRILGRDPQQVARNERMIAEQLAGPGRGVSNPKLLEAIRTVKRHHFVPWELIGSAYEDRAVDIGFDRTIEQPYVIASTIEQLRLESTDRVLEIGTGSGYQTALLAQLVKEVYSVEDHRILAERARVDIQRVPGTTNVFTKLADISLGWPEVAPFDAIIVNNAPVSALENISAQLKAGGRLIVPVSEEGAQILYQKNGSQLIRLSSRPSRPR